MDQGSVIDRIKSGETSVLKDIYTAYRRDFIHWLIRSYACSMDDAKDIYQVSILDFYENVLNNKLVELKSSLKTYLFAIGKNKLLQQRKNLTRMNGLEEYKDINEINNEEKQRQEALTYNEELDKVDSCLQMLGDPCKRILEDFYYYRKNMDEIKDKMNYKNADTVKNLRYKCMKRLRKIFYQSSTTMTNP